MSERTADMQIITPATDGRPGQRPGKEAAARASRNNRSMYAPSANRSMYAPSTICEAEESRTAVRPSAEDAIV